MHNAETPRSEDDAPARASGWEYLDDFSGEQNTNSATGKERTFSEFDLYPRQSGESNEEYGKRLKYMHEKTAEYQAAEAEKERQAAEVEKEDDYFSSIHGQKELDAQAKYDRLEAKLEKAVSEGRMSKDHANRLLERELERFDEKAVGYRQDFEDSKVVGTQEEQDAYQAWLKKHDAENMRNLEARDAVFVNTDVDKKEDAREKKDSNVRDILDKIESEKISAVDLRKIAEALIKKADEYEKDARKDAGERLVNVFSAEADKKENRGDIISDELEADIKSELEAKAKGELEAKAKTELEAKAKEELETKDKSESGVDKKGRFEAIRSRLAEIGEKLREIAAKRRETKAKIEQLKEERKEIEKKIKALKRGKELGDSSAETENDKVLEEIDEKRQASLKRIEELKKMRAEKAPDEVSDIDSENSADISPTEAINKLKSLNEGHIKFNPNYYGGDGAIITDIDPSELNYPDGWYYAKGALRNEHNTTGDTYQEIRVIRSDGTYFTP